MTIDINLSKTNKIQLLGFLKLLGASESSFFFTRGVSTTQNGDFANAKKLHQRKPSSSEPKVTPGDLLSPTMALSITTATTTTTTTEPQGTW